MPTINTLTMRAFNLRLTRERVIKKPLSSLLLFEDLAPGATVTAEVADGELRLRVGA